MYVPNSYTDYKKKFRKIGKILFVASPIISSGSRMDEVRVLEALKRNSTSLTALAQATPSLTLGDLVKKLTGKPNLTRATPKEVVEYEKSKAREAAYVQKVKAAADVRHKKQFRSDLMRTVTRLSLLARQSPSVLGEHPTRAILDSLHTQLSEFFEGETAAPKKGRQVRPRNPILTPGRD